ncbi:MAG: translation initiation factor IF-2 [Candidatus Thermoplasmatota archaeon]|nr:translation initiation factor IF-2 [Candidatus Thermoplasmatota archaeon]
MGNMKRYIRQPIVSVLGHVDHGKTTLLDYIRGTAVTAREAGAITQHIGATEVPIGIIHELCGKLLGGKKFNIPGLLFIDTPGHHAFTTLRSRGGALADLAVLVVDINDGLMPQSLEAINILKSYKTPFVVTINKIDTIQGWKKVDGCMEKRLEQQNSRTRQIFEEKFYDMVEKLFEQGFSSDRYDRIRNFKKNVALIPISAKSGEGVPELLMILVGLAQRFLEDNLLTENGPAEGTVLEVKEEKGLGTTIDVIIYGGTIKKGDTIVIGGKSKPCITSIRALLKPKPLDEIRDPSEKFSNVKEAIAATGIKIAAPGLEDVFSGAPLRVAGKNLEADIDKIKNEMKTDIKTSEEGLIIKADAIGSLEALVHIFKDTPIRKADVGPVSKKDVVEAKTNVNPVNRVVLGFNVKVLPEAEKEMVSFDVNIINSKVIYHLLDSFEEWKEQKIREIEEERRKEIVHPGMILFLPDCTFRVSKPAVIGMRVLAGEIRPEQKLMREDGKIIGKIKSIQKEGKTIEKAIQGMEVAISIEGATVGRQIKPEDVLYVDMPKEAVKKLINMDISQDERDIIDKVIKIKRKSDKFWGT